MTRCIGGQANHDPHSMRLLVWPGSESPGAHGSVDAVEIATGPNRSTVNNTGDFTPPEAENHHYDRAQQSAGQSRLNDSRGMTIRV